VPRTDGEVGPTPEGRDPADFDRLRRRVLWSMPTGLFVVGSRSGARRNMMTCNWAMQVATTPKLVAVAVEQGSVTRALIEEGGWFSVSILSRADRAVVRRFVKPVDAVVLDAGGGTVSMQGEPVVEGVGGVPRLASALAWLDCEVRTTVAWEAEVGKRASHVLCVGEVMDAGEAAGDPSDAGDPTRDAAGVLRMEDTRMDYGG
jgi:flavin reductase (DIM6/NTAB) family NADH-FMN oxidoreductase RutF